MKRNKYEMGGEVNTATTTSNNTGNSFDMAGMANGISGITSHLGEVSNELTGKKFKEQASNYEQSTRNNAINSLNQISGFSTNDALVSGFNLFNPLTSPEIKKKTAGQVAGQHLMAGVKGATAGMSIGGPWGALIGAVAASVADIVGQIGGNSQRKKAQDRLNMATNVYNDTITTALNNQVSNVDLNNDRNAMANYMEFGGFIPTGSGAIDYELANKKLAIDNLFAINTSKTSTKLENGGNLKATIPNFSQHGGIFLNGLEEINAGGSHSSNPLGGVPMGIDQEGVPNMVEEGEVKWRDYIFSNTLKLDDVDAANNNIDSKYVNNTFADIAKKFNKEASERPNDPVSNNTLSDFLTRLMSAQEQERTVEEISKTNEFASGGNLNNWLQAAPIIGSGLAVAGDAFGLTNNNDYRHIDSISAPAATPLISPQTITNYMSYVPLDRDYYYNRQAAQTAATRNAISNVSNSNRGTLINALNATDFGGNIAEGALARQAQEADLNQQLQIANFNRGTNMFNSQQALQAAAQNSDAYRYDAQIKANMEMQKAQMKMGIDRYDQAERDANLSNFYNNLGQLGRENIARNTIESNPGLYYYWDKDGSIKYKNGYENLPEDQKAIIRAHSEQTKPTNTKKCGGKLNLKTM